MKHTNILRNQFAISLLTISDQKNIFHIIQDAIEQLMSINKPPENASLPASETKRGYSSWWYWRRSGVEKQESKDKDYEGKDGEMNAVGTQTSRATSPDGRNPIDYVDQQNLTGQSDLSELNKSHSLEEAKSAETYRKSLRLTTEQIVSGCGFGCDA